MRYRSIVGMVGSIMLFGGCAADGLGDGQWAVSQPGPWQIPPETRAIGDTMWVDNTQGGPWDGGAHCAGGIKPAVEEFRQWLLEAFPQIDSIGGYRCSAIEGSSSMSVHSTGRALDIMIPRYDGVADNDLGDPIGNYLIEHAEEIGIQYIIWDQWQWNGERAPGEHDRMYTGTSNPHTDHLHVELSVDAGNGLTAWFSGPRDLPAVECPALPPDGGVIEETSDCFRAFGPSAYWRSVSAGSGGSMLWTNAFQSSTPGNWARWHVNATTAGQYRLEVYAEDAYSEYHATRYVVRHAGVDHEVVVDLSTASGWVELGTFAFDGGGGEHVNVYDNYAVAVPADQHIPADAVRLTPIGAMQPEPEPGPTTLSILPLLPDVELHFDGSDGMVPEDSSGTLVGGCAAAPGRSRAPLALLLGLAMVGLFLRRR